MADLRGFDANTVEPSKDFGLLPRNDYEVVITESEKKSTQAGDGEYISLTFQVLTGEFQNRKLWLNLNLWNKNPETVQIAKGQLSSICRAVGVMTPNDTAELHDKPFKISVGQRKNKQSGQLENNITGFKQRATGPVQAQSQSTQTALAGATTSSPW